MRLARAARARIRQAEHDAPEIDAGLSYKVRAGTVVGFAIYGPHLSHFAHLTSYEELLAAFGAPDRAREDEAYGDLMGYGAYYWGAQKHVRWDAWAHRTSLINLGAFDGNTGPRPCQIQATSVPRRDVDGGSPPVANRRTEVERQAERLHPMRPCHDGRGGS
ncbi:hypothetical protein ACIOTI_40690 [Streptomyces sp. NPDC087843]|uniref:hypothetical protein n=1 Tax=Streptomyces sp. NPDC087843 TaxID=3365804 RepID=UPI00381AF5AD